MGGGVNPALLPQICFKMTGNEYEVSKKCELG